MAKKPLVLVGGGGHCRSCIDVIELEGRYEIVAILDLASQVGQNCMGYEICGTDADAVDYVEKGVDFLVTVGQIKTSQPRQKVVERLQGLGASFARVVSPLAHVSAHAELACGTIVMHHAIVNACAVVGQHVILNSKSLIEHDATIEDFVHVSTGATINGGVIVGRGSFIGSNATTREYIKIEPGALLRAGEMHWKGERCLP